MSDSKADKTNHDRPDAGENGVSAAGTQAAIDALGVKYTGVTIDSRIVKPGDLFIAYPGEAADGRNHIPEAIAAGAAAVVWDQSEFAWNAEWRVANVPARNLRHSAGYIAEHFFKRPSHHLWVAGVTGTNGKTSCAQWIAQALTRAGKRCATVGTLGARFTTQTNADEYEIASATNTTPDPVSLHGFMAQARATGARAISIEVSSHGIDQGRVNGVEFDVALFTNLSRDHLDYHGTMKAYGEAKARLFEWPGLKYAVVNLDDQFGVQLAAKIDRSRINVIGYGLGKGEIAAHNLDLSTKGLKLEIETPWGAALVHSGVLGAFNAHNILGVLGVLVCSDLSLTEAIDAIGELRAPAGRMQAIREEGRPLVVVDYSHTPDALAKALESLRNLLLPGARLHCVFGAGGDRDTGKRPLMGEVATRLADESIITSDNPRSEEPRAIIDAIISGAHPKYRVEPDRAAAIFQAIVNAQANDIVLIAGKGHETYQEISGKRFPFSDVEVAKAAMKQDCDHKSFPIGGACV